MRASLSVMILVGGVALGGCGSSTLTGSTGTGGTIGQDNSPGTVTFVLTTPPDISFCDQISCAGGGEHLSILTTAGTELNWQGGTSCGVDCSTCAPVPCPLAQAILCPAPEGVTFTGGTSTWDGSFTAMSVCGASQTACSERKYAHPGSYVAKYCVTPGSLSQPDAGLPVCTATGSTVCSETTFNFPTAGTISLQAP